MLTTAAKAAYGEVADWLTEDVQNTKFEKTHAPKVQKIKQTNKQQTRALSFQLGDSVMMYAEEKLGIVCETTNDKGVLRVQLPNNKLI